MGRPRKAVAETRAAETRTASSRASGARAMPQDHQQSALYIPPKCKRPGMGYRWIRMATVGQPDDKNWSEAIQKGWRPVKKSSNPLLEERYPSIPMPGSDYTASDNIILGSLVLMERRMEDILQDRADQIQRTIEANESIDSWVEGGAPGSRFNESSPVEFARAVPRENAAFKPEDDPVA